ncbi:hypothetical protein [Kitasatospora azatica]|uniref:hypothetical protein n=1 Tax=Kitasatospora azatica TaxID=58347 RepID=UPI0005644445|nr:hypothetical protein [Kitasatospora azatica]
MDPADQTRPGGGRAGRAVPVLVLVLVLVELADARGGDTAVAGADDVRAADVADGRSVNAWLSADGLVLVTRGGTPTRPLSD